MSYFFLLFPLPKDASLVRKVFKLTDKITRRIETINLIEINVFLALEMWKLQDRATGLR